MDDRDWMDGGCLCQGTRLVHVGTQPVPCPDCGED